MAEGISLSNETEKSASMLDVVSVTIAGYCDVGSPWRRRGPRIHANMAGVLRDERRVGPSAGPLIIYTVQRATRAVGDLSVTCQERGGRRLCTHS